MEKNECTEVGGIESIWIGPAYLTHKKIDKFLKKLRQGKFKKLDLPKQTQNERNKNSNKKTRQE